MELKNLTKTELLELLPMKTCKNCKYWGKDYDSACDRVTWDDSSTSPTKFDIDVTADDDSGLNAQLITGPDFGCIHFSQKTVDS